MSEREQVPHRLFGARPVRNSDARKPDVERQQRIDDDEGRPLDQRPLQLVARRLRKDEQRSVDDAPQQPVEERDLARVLAATVTEILEAPECLVAFASASETT
jgi:hypothetical protein